MSLIQDHNNFIFQCNGEGCHELLETATSNFDSAKNVLRRARWLPKKSGREEWQHFCPDCQMQVDGQRALL